MATISLSIKPESAQQMLAAAVGPKMAYEGGSRTDTQATDRAGVPLWRVSVFVMDADTTRAPETISVTVPAQVAPALPALSPVVFQGLRVLLWSGGASLRADAVEAVISEAAPVASSFLADVVEEAE